MIVLGIICNYHPKSSRVALVILHDCYDRTHPTMTIFRCSRLDDDDDGFATSSAIVSKMIL